LKLEGNRPWEISVLPDPILTSRGNSTRNTPFFVSKSLANSVMRSLPTNADTSMLKNVVEEE